MTLDIDRDYFVIVQVETGYLFPVTTRGSTRASFDQFGTPRLFKSRVAARSCLGFWMKGECRRRMVASGVDGYLEEYEEELIITEIPDRSNYAYEIVPVRIVFQGEDR